MQACCRGADAGLYESVSDLSQLVGQVLINWQTQPHHTGACFTHEPKVRKHKHFFSHFLPSCRKYELFKTAFMLP